MAGSPWPGTSAVRSTRRVHDGNRGCVSACDYCCITTLHRMVPGKRFRQRRPEEIAAEMAVLYHERGVRQFVFHDDNFLVPSMEKNLERIELLDRSMRKAGIRNIGLVLKCRPQDVHHEVIRRLREMGLLPQWNLALWVSSLVSALGVVAFVSLVLGA